MDNVLLETNQKIQNSLEHFKRELSTIRAGRANPTLIENLPISAYGAKMKLLEVGTISSPQPNLLTVQVWDAGVVQDVVKGIQEANLGLNPSYEGQLVRLPIPPLTEERRAEFIKLAHTKMEQAKIELRQIRQDIRASWDRQMEAGEFGEDEFDRRAKLLQDMIDKTSSQIDEMVKVKEEELVQV
ncbi:ribosome recycling factor [Candidatus Daviesbacteria bacterium RIFOXYD1_FULL_41_10]|uniref:Ribosome-recycling factor n=2 Tax=Candidatus Daviesiibacteriota TaxID=1752718 RepID=A0A1F5N126_9BACT|nr:MAG: Ribosome-recycling factor [Candidatus Daviesbacteria bacterium GW2011_GWB1_41_5]OGE71283.1 MAG: ribosome recycling factor [Candidatus Daviesbacteria bacterium RIFOXYD1_FULL_41_10]